VDQTPACAVDDHDDDDEATEKIVIGHHIYVNKPFFSSIHSILFVANDSYFFK
jgi:hypothetical protein